MKDKKRDEEWGRNVKLKKWIKKSNIRRWAE